MKTIYDLFQEAKRENQGKKPALPDLLLCLIQTQNAREVDEGRKSVAMGFLRCELKG